MSACHCAAKGFEFCDCPEPRADGPASQQRVAELEREVARLRRAEALLLDAVHHAEWHDKHIHPYHGETFQNWKLDVYLPVRLSETDKSPEAALRRALDA